MAATAAASIGSSFPSSMHTLKYCMRSNNVPLIKLSSLSPPRMLASSSSTSRSYYAIDHVNIGTIAHNKWRVLKISAALAQEEAATTATDEEAGMVEEEVNKVEGDGDGEVKAEAVPEPEEPTLNTKLYFGNLPYNIDSAQLAGIIQDHASPELIEVLYDRNTGRSRGFAFVTMSSVEDCNAVIENLDGSEYLGRNLRVNFSDKPRSRAPLYAETEYKLFVGNLSWTLTNESLSQAFQQYGNVVGARVLYDGETGMSRGYGFVCYSTKSEMEAAIESLNGAVSIPSLSSLSCCAIFKHTCFNNRKITNQSLFVLVL
ncbi:hypothetical protein Ddye_018954 [Dipteronia dyeriana]|uniref:RRM domain-containing protein n=1 Tax=Dipteronia dyeriana TaxID=168575 RepID=A0AAD9TXX8_9ROSI|nr:hypothetical protein Ddye_018954 [Dipteronia dyeriana]